MLLKSQLTFFLILTGIITLLACELPGRQQNETSLKKVGWTNIVAVNVSQEKEFLILEIVMSDTIPSKVNDSSVIQILLNTDSDKNTWSENGLRGVDHVIEFQHSNWDGSRWFAMFLNGKLNKSLWPGDSHRMFDWNISGNKINIRFSLISLGWSKIELMARIYYKEDIVSIFPGSDFFSFEVNNEFLNNLNTVTSERTVFIYPHTFEELMNSNQIPLVCDEAYKLEEDLTGVKPVGGDTLRFIFHPLYDGAAIEGDPIYIGPGMWGKTVLWFVYFHEMGHNFCNIFENFAIIYPLQFSVPPGTMPTNILFYEAFASLPAMYVYDQIELNRIIPGVSDTVTSEIIDDWQKVRIRFSDAWTKYKSNPEIQPNPDIVDGLFLELKDEFGWDIFKNYYRIIASEDHSKIFKEKLSDDTPDLKKTRSTLTAAILSAAANTDLSSRFENWRFPIDAELFTSAMSKFSTQ